MFQEKGGKRKGKNEPAPNFPPPGVPKGKEGEKEEKRRRTKLFPGEGKKGFIYKGEKRPPCCSFPPFLLKIQGNKKRGCPAPLPKQDQVSGEEREKKKKRGKRRKRRARLRYLR